MPEPIKLEVNLRAYVRRETKRRWSAICPMLGVASQGVTKETAKSALQEAVELWFESCVERGVLDQALREAIFRPLAADQALPDDVARVRAKRLRSGDDESVLGADFAIQLSIPAYQASTFLAAQ